ncbi:hypothetical protein KIPB_005788, partial [Kipferlia bialata]|eukprot:g5788.t1
MSRWQKGERVGDSTPDVSSYERHSVSGTDTGGRPSLSGVGTDSHLLSLSLSSTEEGGEREREGGVVDMEGTPALADDLVGKGPTAYTIRWHFDAWGVGLLLFW